MCILQWIFIDLKENGNKIGRNEKVFVIKRAQKRKQNANVEKYNKILLCTALFEEHSRVDGAKNNVSPTINRFENCTFIFCQHYAIK